MIRRLFYLAFLLPVCALLALVPLAANAAPVPFTADTPPAHSWMIGSGPLSDLNQIDPATATSVFDVSTSAAIGHGLSGWATTKVTDYKSYASFVTNPASTHWVLLDLESWSYTPLNEQQNPGLYMAKFAALAHARGEQVILTPARDLMSVSSAVCHRLTGETTDHAYIRCHIPGLAASAPGDVVEIQAQADQGSVAKYSWLVANGEAQVTTGVPVWAGVTTDRGDPVSAMVACYDAVEGSVQGFWLNSTASTIGTADQFLKSVSP